MIADAIAFDVGIDLAQLDRAILRYNEELGIEIPAIVKRTARQLALELMRATPPRSLAQGRAAVARDIGRAMLLFDPATLTSPRLRALVQAGNFEGVKAFLARSREAGKTKMVLERFSPELHTKARNKEGRVRGRQNVAVMDRVAFRRYVREIQQHVGATRYAFGNAAQKLGETRVPSWVLRHSPSLGDLSEKYSGEDSSVEMTNRGPGIGHLSPGLVQGVVDRRARAMNRDVDQVLAGRASRYFD